MQLLTRLLTRTVSNSQYGGWEGKGKTRSIPQILPRETRSKRKNPLIGHMMVLHPWNRYWTNTNNLLHQKTVLLVDCCHCLCNIVNQRELNQTLTTFGSTLCPYWRLHPKSNILDVATMGKFVRLIADIFLCCVQYVCPLVYEHFQVWKVSNQPLGSF